MPDGSERKSNRRERSTALISQAIATVESREGHYGDPYHDMCRTADIWSSILGFKVLPSAVPLCMIGLKLARAANSYKDDNSVDIVGYANVYEETILGMKEDAEKSDDKKEWDEKEHR